MAAGGKGARRGGHRPPRKQGAAARRTQAAHEVDRPKKQTLPSTSAGKDAPRRSKAPDRKKRGSRKKVEGSRRPEPAKSRRDKPGTRLAPPPGLAAAALRLLGCLILFILLGVTLQSFFQSISASGDRYFWRSAPFFFFGLGALVFPLVLWGFPEWLLYLYVFGHEFTHVVFIYLCGGKVQGPMRVSLQGGHVVTNKTNLLISLSPYFIPFYAVIVMSSFVMAASFVDLNASHTLVLGSTALRYEVIYLLYAFIGFTMTMHVHFTVSMIAKDQPDLQMNGRLLSLLFILLINALIVTALVIVASSAIEFRDSIQLWLDNLHRWLRFGFLQVTRHLG